MSEYQYYEFVAIDEPLTPKQMAELRSRSSRASITPTSFVNDYQWGDLKGDPVDWMRRYFDAHIYVANWCTCCLYLRVPRGAFDTETLQTFETESVFSVDQTNIHWLLGWALSESENYDRFATEDGRGWMGRLASLRDELLRGDMQVEAERRVKHETYLRLLAADFDRCWQVADNRAERGIASAYDEVKRALVELAEAYTLCASRVDFDRKLAQFMTRHGKRGALVRRLVDAGLWKTS